MSLWDKSLNILEWPSQSLDLNPIEHLWRDLKIATQQHSPSNLTRIWIEEWEKLPKYRCSVIPKKTRPVIAAKGASTKYFL
jgi:transposase